MTQHSVFRKKITADYIELNILADQIIELKNKLHNLEESAIQTNQGQEHLRCRLEYHHQLQTIRKQP